MIEIFRPVVIVSWPDAKGKRDLDESLTYLYNECHIDRYEIEYVSEELANQTIHAMGHYGGNSLIPSLRRLLK